MTEHMTLSRFELTSLMRLASRCAAARSVPQLEGVLSSLGDFIPFRKAAMCAIPVRTDPVLLMHSVNHSYGTWGELYEREQFQRVDPVLMQCRRMQNGAFSWRRVLWGDAIRGSETFVEAARDFGLIRGITYTCASASHRTILSLAGTSCDSERALAIAEIVGPHVHEAYSRVLELRGANGDLSPREREVLRWTQEGKTYWEIGRILGISERTVKYHFERIKSKLDAVSPPHAVAKAMRMKLIE